MENRVTVSNLFLSVLGTTIHRYFCGQSGDAKSIVVNLTETMQNMVTLHVTVTVYSESLIDEVWYFRYENMILANFVNLGSSAYVFISYLC